jgi:dTDP-4-dehydrorhamnose 3,5-epimerase
MEIRELNISGVFEIKNFISKDKRGVFVKTFNEEKFTSLGFNVKFTESYYSQSQQDVIRGMHFQLPPNDHEKLIYVSEGVILDVILDLRKFSDTYGKFVFVELQQFGSSVFIPKGCAHGFLSISKVATVIYNVTSVYNSDSDTGILWNSFGFDWGVKTPIISDRDKSFEPLSNFKSPFL